jgi:hypothetical protein
MHLEAVSESPYDKHPELLEIWPNYKAELLRDMQDCLDHPELERSFLMVEDGEVVGITGFYKYDDQVGLNWHGVMKKYERRGYSLKALRLLTPLAKAFYPYATHLVEEMPSDQEGDLGGFFRKMGFEHTGRVVNKPWVPTDTTWFEWRRPL